MNITDNLLNRLDGVKRTGKFTWIAKCPAHDDRSPSLSIRETTDGRLLVHCFGGCAVDAVLSAVNLELGDLFPDSQSIGHANPERKPFPASDILRIVAHEALVVLMACDWLVARREIDAGDLKRLELANWRLREALAAGGIEP